MEWITENLATIAALLAVLAAAGIAVLIIIRNKKKGKTSCGCGCASCPLSSDCHKK